MDIDKVLALLIEEARRIWQYRIAAISCAWVVAAVGWVGVRTLPDEYTASARVYVSAETVLAPLLKGLTVPTDAMEQVSLITQALLSRPHLEAVIVSSGIEAKAQPTGLRRLLFGDGAADEAGIDQDTRREKMIDTLRKKIQVIKNANESVYQISYANTDPVIARTVVGSLLDDFISKSKGEDVEQSAQAEKFLEAQIASYEKRLTEAEERVADFKKKNLGMMPGTAGDFYARFQTAQTAAETLQFQVRAQMNRRDELARQLSGGGLGSGAASPESMSTSVDPAIRDLESQLLSLRQRFTDKHPDVIRIKQTLADLQQTRDAERRTRAAGGLPSGAGLESNPVYRQMAIALSAADAELASLQAQLGQKNAEVANLRSMATTMPEVEAQVARLNRDYDIVKTEYETLLQRLNSLRLNQQVQQDNKNINFRVLDPPKTPNLPSGPNRLALNSLVLVAAIAGGLALAFLLSQRDLSFFSATSLKEAAGLPVYGLIGIAGAATIPREWRFEIALGGLLLAFAGLLIFGQTTTVSS